MMAKKSLGQNFLNSTEIVTDIITASNVQKESIVLEIGPGKGILTSALLSAGAKVICVEKDDQLIPVLQKKFAKNITFGQLKIVHGDILEFNIKSLISSDYKVIANIPYYITGQIIRMFLESEFQPKSMTLLLQKEVVERIVAKDGKESLLSLSVKIFGNPRYVRTVSRNVFSPQPNVDSAILHIENISKNNFPEARPGGRGFGEKFFFKILHAGFAHKRKQLISNLSSLYKKGALLKYFEKSGLNPKCRAEDLPLEAWIKLCKMLESIK